MMFGLGQKSEPSRKYIDLIRKVSSQWANWSPSVPIQVGDYGKIDKTTGCFDREGSVYTAEATAHFAAQYPEKKADGRQTIQTYISDTVKCLELHTGAELGIPQLAQASLKGKWQFSKKHGAMLIIARPLVSYMPPELLSHPDLIRNLEDKLLITKVTSCPAYSLYLSTRDAGIVSLDLLGTSPVPGGMTATASGGGGWQSCGITGHFQCGSEEQDCFSPLFTLKTIPKRSKILFRDGPVAEQTPGDLWVDAVPPWDPLDEEGNEEPFVDTIFYSDEEEDDLDNEET